MTPQEKDLRIQLAACYRIFAMHGWTDVIFNHITLRIPGSDPHFLINPFGLRYDEVTASNLVKIDLNGEVMGNSPHPVNPAGFVLHSAIHAGIPDAHCVMHTHTVAGSAVACSQSGLTFDNFYAIQLVNRLAYHDFEGITVHADEGPRVIQSIGDKQAVILRNHGLLSWGSNLADAYVHLAALQMACEIQVAGAGLGPRIPIPQAVQQQSANDALQFQPNARSSGMVFDALVRQVDRLDPSYRDL